MEDTKKSKSRTYKAELENITDSGISEGVLSDKDSVVPTAAELEEFTKPKESGNEKTVDPKDIGRSKGKTGWAHLKRNRDSQVNGRDCPPLTQHEISQLENQKKIIE